MKRVKDLQVDKKKTLETCRKGVRSLLAVLENCVDWAHIERKKERKKPFLRGLYKSHKLKRVIEEREWNTWDYASSKLH